MSSENQPGALQADSSSTAQIVYILYFVGFITGITAIIGLVIAYVSKDAAPDWLKTHYNNQINLFWKGLIFVIVGSLLSFILIGFVVILWWLIWTVVRSVKGLQALGRNEPIASPGSWGF